MVEQEFQTSIDEHSFRIFKVFSYFSEELGKGSIFEVQNARYRANCCLLFSCGLGILTLVHAALSHGFFGKD